MSEAADLVLAACPAGSGPGHASPPGMRASSASQLSTRESIG